MNTDQSLGHVANIGAFEYFHAPSGDLYRAPLAAPVMPSGYRGAARFECAPRSDGHAEYLAAKAA